MKKLLSILATISLTVTPVTSFTVACGAEDKLPSWNSFSDINKINTNSVLFGSTTVTGKDVNVAFINYVTELMQIAGAASFKNSDSFISEWNNKYSVEVYLAPNSSQKISIEEHTIIEPYNQNSGEDGHTEKSYEIKDTNIFLKSSDGETFSIDTSQSNIDKFYVRIINNEDEGNPSDYFKLSVTNKNYLKLTDEYTISALNGDFTFKLNSNLWDQKYYDTFLDKEGNQKENTKDESYYKILRNILYTELSKQLVSSYYITPYVIKGNLVRYTWSELFEESYVNNKDLYNNNNENFEEYINDQLLNILKSAHNVVNNKSETYTDSIDLYVTDKTTPTYQKINIEYV